MASNPTEPAARDPLREIEEALARARPAAPQREGARRLQLQAVLAAVLGPEVGLPRLGRFVIEQRVGAGGMGVVFRGRDPETGTPAAIKVLGRDASQERSRFEREATLLKAIDHPHVVRYLDDGLSDDGLVYLVMEWLEGCDLASRLASRVLDVREALSVGVQLAEALLCAHQAGIVHRDVKPSNVFLVQHRVDAVKLIDFGIARSARTTLNGAKLTATGAILGSPHYMAPEQIRGHHDPRTDVYGIGATLFEGLSGRPPFLGENATAVLLSVMAEPVPSLAMLRDDLPPGLDALIGRMLAKEMGERPRDMAAVVAELSDLLARPLDRERPTPALSRQERPLIEVTSRAPDASRRAIDETEDGTEEPVGRVREIAQIRGIVAESEQEELASVVVVTGDAGLGKTHLLRHVLHALPPTAGPAGWRVLSTSGRSEERGVPLAALRPLAASQSSDEPGLDGCRARMLGLVDALSGPWSASRPDPRVIADQLHLAWLELLELWSRGGPLLIVVDDAASADASTLRFLDRALSHLRHRSVVVVAAARSLAFDLVLGTELPAERRLHVHLGPLHERGARRLVARWRVPGSTTEAARLVAVANGNPAHIRELCRDAREGSARGPSSMAEITWDRLHRLDPEGRRLLRAGSLFGKTFWLGAVGALLGLERDDARVLPRLDALVASGYLRRSRASRIAGEVELTFASELLMLAAYELNTAEDLRRGHAAAAAWLQRAGGVGAAVIAAHLSAAGDMQAALPLYLQAARAALSGEEPTAFDEHIARAEACAPDAEAAAEIAELRALRAFWAGRMDEAAITARSAWSTVTRASEGWFRVASLAITAAGQCGDNASVRELAASLHEAGPGSAVARDARLVGLCRAQTQLENADLGEPWLREAVEVEEAAAGPEVRAWLARSRSTLAARRSFDASIEAMVVAHLAHVEAGDQRSAAQIGIFLGSYYLWSGAWERAARSIDDALAVASRLGASYLVSWGEYARGKLEVETAPLQKAIATLDSVIANPASSVRFRVGANLHVAVAALRAGDAPEAERRARAVRQRSAVPWVERASAAALCRSLLEQGRAEEARPLASELAPLAPENLIVELDELVMLARVELASALGDDAGAAQALSEAVATIERRAATLSDPLRRNDYLARPHIVARTLEWARR